MAQDHTQRPSQPIVNDLPIARRNWDARFFEKNRQRLASRHHGALQSGSKILGQRSASSSEFATANNGEHHGRQDQCGSSASRAEKESVRKTNNGKGKGKASDRISLEDLQPHVGKKREDVAKFFDISVSTAKRVFRDHGISRWPDWRSNSVSVSTFKRVCREHGITRWPNQRSNNKSILKGHVSESGNLVAPSQTASRVLQTVPTTTHMIPQTGSFMEAFQLKGQLMQSTSHPNPNALVVPQPQGASTQMLNENMLSVEDCKKILGLDEETSPEGHVSYARLKVTYRDKTIKFELPLMSGKSELKKEVEKRLELELSSFDLWYKDEDGDWIFLGRDEDFRNHLQFFCNQVIKLLIVDKDGNFANCL